MIVGVLLAGGEARRFGSDKLLARLPDGRTVAETSARAMVSALGEVVAVVRPGEDERQATLEAAGCRVSVCEAAGEGMGASLACGVSAAPDASGWVVALADMPAVRAETIARVAAMIEGQPETIVAPVYGGRRGHPVGFGLAYATALAGLSGDTGARRVVEENRHRLQLFEAGDPGVVLDVDRPSDLHRVGGR